MTGPWIAAWVALAVVSVVTTVLVLGLLRRFTVVLHDVEYQLVSRDRLGGVSVGGALPSFEVTSQLGLTVSSSELVDGPGIMLLISQDCAPCESLVDELADLGRSPTQAPLVAIGQYLDSSASRALSGIDLFLDVTAFERMNISATPFAMAFDSRGIVLGRTVPNSAESLRELETVLPREVISADPTPAI